MLRRPLFLVSLALLAAAGLALAAYLGWRRGQAEIAEVPFPYIPDARVTLARLAHRTRERDAALLVMGVVADLENVLGDHRSCAPPVVTEGLLQAI